MYFTEGEFVKVKVESEALVYLLVVVLEWNGKTVITHTADCLPVDNNLQATKETECSASAGFLCLSQDSDRERMGCWVLGQGYLGE